MFTLVEPGISRKGDQHGNDKCDTVMGNGEDAEPSVSPSALDSELARRLIDKVSRSNQAGHSDEVHRINRLGDYIRSARHKLKLSRAEVATRTGLPIFFLIAIENGLVTREEATVDQFSQLSESLGIPLDALKEFLFNEGLVEHRVSATETNRDHERRPAMGKLMAQLMKSVTNMSRMKKIMVMMVTGMFLVILVAMGMTAKEMMPFGM